MSVGRFIHSSPFPKVNLPKISLPRFLHERIEGHPHHKAAYIDGLTGTSLTFGQFLESVDACQKLLYHKWGVRKGDTVAIFASNTIDYPVILHSFLGIGAVVTQGSPRSSEQEMTHQLETSGAKFVVLDCDIIFTMKPLPQIQTVFSSSLTKLDSCPLEYILEESNAYINKPLPKLEFDPMEDVALMPYSSGTIGGPKGVCLTHYNLVSNLLQTNKEIIFPQLASRDIVSLALLPAHFPNGTLRLNQTLFSGQTSVILDTFYLKSVLRALSDFNITFAGLTPPVLHSLATNPLVDKYTLNLTHIGTSGGALNKYIAEKVEARLNCRVFQSYGMTEASPALIVAAGNQPVKHLSVGFPLPNTELRIFDPETGKDISTPNTWGTILAKGPQIMKCYHNDPVATKKAISEDGWLYTGDVGYVDEEGYVYIVDRERDIIKYRGSTPISPSELERIIQQHPAVCDVVVVPSFNENKEEVPKAYIVLSDDVVDKKTPTEILQFLNKQVPEHKQIHCVEVLSVLPRNTSGKVLRQELAQREREAIGTVCQTTLE